MIFAVVILVFVGFAFAIIVRPSNIIALSISLFGFEQWAQANSGFFASHASLINLGFGVLCLFAILVVVMRGNNPLNPITTSMCVWGALISLAAISCLWSIDRELSIFMFKYNLPSVVAFVALVPLVIQDREDLHNAMISTLFFGTIVMALLLMGTHIHAWGRTIEVAAGTAVVDRVGQLRTRLAPLAIGALAGKILIISVLMNFRGIGRVWQQARWPIAVMALTLIYRSGSRGQFIAAIISVLTLIMFSRGTKRAIGWVTASISAFMVIGIAAWSFIGTAGPKGRWDLDNMQSAFSQTRIEFSAILLRYWAESSPMNWIFGLGSSASYDVRILGRYCHVTMVEVLAELGFVGFVLLVSFGILVARDMIRLYRLTVDSDVDRGVAIAMSGLFVFAFILSFKQGTFLTNTALFSSGLMIGRQAEVMRLAYRREHAKEMHRRWREYYARFGQIHGQASPQA